MSYIFPVSICTVKRRPKFKGYLPKTKSEVLKHNVGSHANALVYPEREQAEALDDVPQYIYPANLAKFNEMIMFLL
jgi:hypothetical protein